MRHYAFYGTLDPLQLHLYKVCRCVELRNNYVFVLPRSSSSSLAQDAYWVVQKKDKNSKIHADA